MRDRANSGETAFEVIPAIDLKDGDVVQLVGGEPGTGRTYGDPAATARRWVNEGATRLHLVDLDGAFEGRRRNADAIAAIREAVDVPVQLGGGIRTADDARDLLDRGVDAVILGTAAVEDPQMVATLAEAYPGRIFVSLDAKGGEVVVEGWTRGAEMDPVEAAGRYAELGAGAILFTDVDVEGQLAGVRTTVLEDMAAEIGIPIIASGGVSSVADLRALRDAGARAAVVGTALYEGKLSLADARDALSL